MTRLRADALLLLIAVIWGTAFVFQKAGNADMTPLWFVAVRFAISATALAGPALVERRRATQPLSRASLGIAAALGACLAVGACLQQTALVTATATNAGFLTALYVVLVPFTSWLLTRQRIRRTIVLASLMAVAGAYLLGAHGALASWTVGDTLLIVSDIAWAFAISLASIFMMRANRPYFMAFVQFAITAVVGLVAALVLEGTTVPNPLPALAALFYTAILSGAIAYTLQLVAQRHTTAPEAALIMSLESVFAAVAAAIWFGERLTPLGVLGCVLILLAVVAVEVGPLVLGKRLDRFGR